MSRRVVYPARYATHSPHPLNHILRNMGQNSKFCPKSGLLLCFRRFAKSPSNQRGFRCLGRAGRAGQKYSSSTCARSSRGLGVCCLVCRSIIYALCAPRAPPPMFMRLFSVCCLFGLLMQLFAPCFHVLPHQPRLLHSKSTSCFKFNRSNKI